LDHIGNRSTDLGDGLRFKAGKMRIVRAHRPNGWHSLENFSKVLQFKMGQG